MYNKCIKYTNKFFALTVFIFFMESVWRYIKESSLFCFRRLYINDEMFVYLLLLETSGKCLSFRDTKLSIRFRIRKIFMCR